MVDYMRIILIYDFTLHIYMYDNVIQLSSVSAISCTVKPTYIPMVGIEFM